MWWVGKFLWVMRLCALFILLLILPAPDRVCTSRRTAHIRQCRPYVASGEAWGTITANAWLSLSLSKDLFHLCLSQGRGHA